MNYSDIAYKIINQVIKIEPYQSVIISAEIHNVHDFDEPLVAIPFLEELAIVARKHKGLPLLDISTENIHKRFFEEIEEENKGLSTELFNKWLSTADLFIDLSWRSNPIFYKSIPERAFKRLNLSPREFIKIFEERNKKLLMLGYPTLGLAKYLEIDHDKLEKGYFTLLNADYFELKKKCQFLEGKLSRARFLNIITENRTLNIELRGEAKSYYGEFGEDCIAILPTGYWQQSVNTATINGIVYFDNVYYEQYIWHNIQIIYEFGRIVDVETDIQQKNMNLLKSVLFYDADTVYLNIGQNEGKCENSFYSLFEMVKNKNLSLTINSQKGQVIALSTSAGLFETNDNNILG